jgi:hypothetical protein
MSDFERLLVPGCTELPACRCGTEMHIARTNSLAGKSDTHIRVYDCPACHHEMRLTVWGANPVTCDRLTIGGPTSEAISDRCSRRPS